MTKNDKKKTMIKKHKHKEMAIKKMTIKKMTIKKMTIKERNKLNKRKCQYMSIAAAVFYKSQGTRF